MRGLQCSNPECLYLHVLGDDGDSFTKDQMMHSRQLFYDQTRPQSSKHWNQELYSYTGCLPTPPNASFKEQGSENEEYLDNGSQEEEDEDGDEDEEDKEDEKDHDSQYKFNPIEERKSPLPSSCAWSVSSPNVHGATSAAIYEPTMVELNQSSKGIALKVIYIINFKKN